jgi:alkanesulfonate monooxygenase SsuD/methylene tetrahydromethanopterin reductase-like flavin-dependent oxidoreductase (luciferase family)
VPPQVVEALINLGMLGPILAAMGWYVLRREHRFDQQLESLREQLHIAQESRVGDAQRVADRIVQLLDRQHDVLADTQLALDRQVGVLDRVREAVERLQPRR